MQLEQELKEKTADIEKLLERMLPEEAGLHGWRQADSSITDR